jgi:hypothetical protein
VLPGQACELLGVVDLVAAAVGCELTPTRLDVAWDVPREVVTPAQVRDAFLVGDVVSRIHRAEVEGRPGEIAGWSEHRNGEGHTVYLGSRSSGRMLRVYDRRGPTRVELEVKGDRAALLWGWLLEHAEADWSAAAMSHLRDFVDFRVQDSTEQCRRTLLPWWAGIVAGADRKALPISRKPVSLDGLGRWARHSLAAVLAVLEATEGPGYLVDLTLHGRSRWTRRHRGLLAAGRASVVPLRSAV